MWVWFSVKLHHQNKSLKAKEKTPTITGWRFALWKPSPCVRFYAGAVFGFHSVCSAQHVVTSRRHCRHRREVRAGIDCIHYFRPLLSKSPSRFESPLTDMAGIFFMLSADGLKMQCHLAGLGHYLPVTISSFPSDKSLSATIPPTCLLRSWSQ